jgi:hypothetical protein
VLGFGPRYGSTMGRLSILTNYFHHVINDTIEFVKYQKRSEPFIICHADKFKHLACPNT